MIIKIVSLMIKITKSIFEKVYKRRGTNVHKYDFGHLLVIGGSKMYSGSPALASISAYKTGVDLVTVASPKRAADIIATFSPNLITYPLDGDYVTTKNLPELLKLSQNKTAVVIGGGMERNKETFKLIRQFLKITKLPCVIDADAIYAISQNKGVVRGKNFVITPHLYEFFILTDEKIENKSLNERIKIVKKEALKLKTIILLKANTDIISDGRKVALNRTGNPFMTVGGTGDTLAGICGSFLAQGIDPFTSACVSAYINGKAGDIASLKFKQGFTASDLIKAIPEVME